ncbi:uncharacterized protein LOC118407129 [Branchiostoma floridae]|uniref:Uncharacterized protein LOC118407129 n=1 Tax=Branchiostoma floridae TaxID=7739 RepID=A0A9J7KAQ8_BRAFL|nr:uncharacterized protein LOC118407129 [Branchiostoma floridae]
MAEAVVPSTDEEGIGVQLKRLPKQFALTEDATIEMGKEEALAEAEKRLRDMQATTTRRSLSRQQSTPESEQHSKDTFTQTKSMAQGFMDMALLVANAGQLKLVLTEGRRGRIFMYEFVLALLVSSIIVQIVVGILLYIKSRQNENNPTHRKRLNMVNNVSTGLVMIITVLNVFISAFVIVDQSVFPSTAQAPATVAWQPVLPTVGPTTSTLAHTTPTTAANVPASTCVCPTFPTD